MTAPVPRGPLGRLPFREIVVGDTETTGLCPEGLSRGLPSGDPHGPDRVCSAAFLLLCRARGVWEAAGSLSFSCDPGRPVGERAAAVNGLHWSGGGVPAPPGRADLSGLPSFADLAPRMLGFLGGRPLAFHHAAFDAAFLDAELGRAGLPPLEGSVLCTKKAFCDLRGLGRPDGYVQGTTLNALCDLLRVDRSGRLSDGGETHGAEVDCRMAASCLGKLDAAGWMLAEDIASLPHRRPASAPPPPR